MELNGKKFLLLGLARTGKACARFLVNRGATVSVSDRRSEAELKEEMTELEDLALSYFLGGEDRQALAGVDCVIPSPGVAADNPLLCDAVAGRIPVLSEIEIAYRFLPAPLVAITGTNGKSTTTTLAGEMLKAGGRKVFIGGNIGAPLIGFVAGEWEWGVVEISSFQLEWVKEFRPRIAALLNLSEDHLDRYPDFAAYCQAKERIFTAQTQDDIAILNRDDPLVWALRERLAARVVSFGFGEVTDGVYALDDAIIWRDGSREEEFPLSGVKIHGIHNVENMMAAIAVAKAVGVSQAAIQRSLEEFPGLEHRLEFVRERNGVRFYNDSKGTNVGAVMKSLASFSAPVLLLAGGVDKGGGYGVLREAIQQKVRRLILFGAARRIIANALGDLTATAVVEDLAQAVRDAAEHAQPGDVVLFSPACSSFDMFRNYAERGKAFKSLVQAL
ncbi:MAG: UDP-N-acetylmuramoyl-L-alanine--D-glutamate ligase [Alphaproteobacteria bacterium]